MAGGEYINSDNKNEGALKQYTQLQIEDTLKSKKNNIIDLVSIAKNCITT